MKIGKISAELRKKSLNDWNTILPRLKRHGRNQLAKLVTPFVIGIEIIYDRDNSGYVPYLSISHLLDKTDKLIPFIFLQLKFDNLSTIHISFNTENDITEIATLAKKHIEFIAREKYTIEELLDFFLSLLNNGSHIFLYHLDTYVAILYLISISNKSDSEKIQLFEFYKSEIKKKEISHRRLFNDKFDDTILNMEMFFESKENVENIIQHKIKLHDLNNLASESIFID
jgi:hypothetical protein